jgi:RNA polymerase sigma-32 factor
MRNASDAARVATGMDAHVSLSSARTSAGNRKSGRRAGAALTRAEKHGKPALVPRSPKTAAKKGGRAARGSEPPREVAIGAHERERAGEEGEDQEHEAERGEAEGEDELATDTATEESDDELGAPGEDEAADEAEGEGEGETGRGSASAPLSRPMSSTAMERLDPMAAYLREVQRHPLLTPEQTHDLATRFVTTQDPALAAQLVTANLRLVVKIAYEYRRAYKNIMDLVQEGNIGLMQAVKRYDPYRGVKLSSYAAWWIRAYILRFILNNWRLVKLGTTQAQRKLFFNLRKKRAELQAMGIDPTNAEIAKQLNVPESDVAEMDVRLAQSEKSLDAPVGDADGRAIAKVDMMPAAGAGPETQMADEELQALLKDKLAEFRHTLAGKEKDLAIFDLRLVSDDPLTLQDLGDKFGISRERVRQLEQRLLARLRDYLKREMGDATETL